MNKTPPELQYLDPLSGDVLAFHPDERGAEGDGVWQAGEGRVWPQIDGIAFLRAGRESMATEAVALLRRGERTEALALLLTDVDDFAANAPERVAAMAVANDVATRQCSAVQAMRRLAFGAVADYFAMRPSTPTFVSGIELLANHVDDHRPVIELACGLGHFLSHLARHGVGCAGCDVTFSKLWLGRRFLLPVHVPLVCADISGGHTFAATCRSDVTVFCHDAFYFLPDKPRAARRLEALAGAGGQVLLGHVHLVGHDHAGIGGELLDAEGYARLFSSASHVYEDAALVRAWSTRSEAVPVAAESLSGREAMAMATGRTKGRSPMSALRLEPPNELLYPNPLLKADARGRLHPDWPSTAFAREYAEADYLGGSGAPEPAALPRRAIDIDVDEQIGRVCLPGPFVSLATVPLRWALVGCGWVARDHVLPGFAHAPSARLAAICDTDAARLTSCLGSDARPARYTDHRTMLENEDIDAVYIATPNHLHAGICIDAAAAGCDVLCEKPVASTLGDARAMLAACRGTGVTYATAFDQRFHEAHHVLRQSVREGRLGLITQARVHYACHVDAAWRASADDTDNWRLDRARAGGGAVIDLAPHAIDLLAYLLGDEPCALDLRLQPRMGSAPDEVDAGGILSIEFSRHSLATVHVSYQTPEFLPRRDIELIGTVGGARAMDTMGQTPGGRIEWRYRNGNRTETFADEPALSPFARQLEAFSAARLKKRTWPYEPTRDLAHFALLLDALERAEAEDDARRGEHVAATGSSPSAVATESA